MAKLRLVPKIGNVLPFPKNRSSTVCKFTFVELQELAERDNFSRIPDGAGVRNPTVPKAVLKTWNEGEEFDASKFDVAYKAYEANFFRK